MTGKFQGKDGAALRVRLEQISDRCFLTEEAFEYLDDAGKIEVPANFLTDLASIPKCLQFFEGRHGRHTLAALLHDFQVNDKSSLSERTRADDRFRQTLTELGVRRWRANAMWAAVHLMSRFVSESWVAKLSTALWLLMAFSGYAVLVAAAQSCDLRLIAVALFGPFVGATLWLLPSPSLRRYQCGVVAGLALSVLGPFAVVNLMVMGFAWTLDRYRGSSKPPFQWEGATMCPAKTCKCGRASSALSRNAELKRTDGS